MVDAPIPLPAKIGQMARAKDQLRNKIDNKDFDRGFAPPPEVKNASLTGQEPNRSGPINTNNTAGISTADQVRNLKKNSLSIVSSDHRISDSPNANHINENMGRSTAMAAVKTLSKRKSLIDGKSRPLGKKMRRRYVYENEMEQEVTDSSNTSSPKEKNKKPEKRGNLVTINAKLDNDK
jgi:hypothetical protein